MPVLVSILGQTHKHSIILNESVSSTAERYAPAGVLSRFLPRNRSYLHSIRSSLPCILAERYLMETYDILSYPSLSRSNPGYHGLHSHTPFLHDEIHAIYATHLFRASHKENNHAVTLHGSASGIHRCVHFQCQIIAEICNRYAVAKYAGVSMLYIAMRL